MAGKYEDWPETLEECPLCGQLSSSKQAFERDYGDTGILHHIWMYHVDGYLCWCGLSPPGWKKWLEHIKDMGGIENHLMDKVMGVRCDGPV